MLNSRSALLACCILALQPLISRPAAADPQDPLEPVNRRVFTFNVYADKWLLRPVAKLYHHLPDPVENSVANVFANLLEPANVINDVLQWKWRAAGRDTGRFAVNSTLGIVGLFDVADHFGWKNAGGEDFGQTFRHWGIPAGPYLMLPLLGPSTATDLAGMPLDMATNPVTYLESDTARYSATGVRIVAKRASLFAIEDMLPKDSDPVIERDKRYSAVRSAYLQNRVFKTQDGKVKDDFGDEAPLDDLEPTK